MEEGHLLQVLPGKLLASVCARMYMRVCASCYVYVHCSSAGKWVLITVKELLVRLFLVNGCIQYPVAFSELMVSLNDELFCVSFNRTHGGHIEVS